LARPPSTLLRLGPILLLQLPGPQWILKQSWRSIANKRVNGAEKPMARTGSFNASSMCIGNNRSTVMTRRKRAESTRTDRNWSRIVRRMVVVSCAEKSGETDVVRDASEPEKVRALAGGGCSPPQTFLHENSLLTGKTTGNFPEAAARVAP
jgi:hypothetical protein